MDVGMISVLLIIGTFMRRHFEWFRNLLIPAPITAGLLGLIFGPEVLGWMPFSGALGDYSTVLIAVVFASMPYSMTFASKDASKAKNMWAFSTSMFLDQQTVKSISGASTDFMIAFGIASIKPDAVADFLVPLLILFVLGIAYCCVFFFVFAPLFFGDQWLERGIFGWGWATAAVATGIALLKIVDPDLKSGTMNEYGIAYVGFAPFEIGMNIVAPIAVIAGFTWGIGGIATVFAIAVILFAAFRGWFPKRTGRRPGKASAH